MTAAVPATTAAIAQYTFDATFKPTGQRSQMTEMGLRGGVSHTHSRTCAATW
jgi:hypothetical protein